MILLQYINLTMKSNKLLILAIIILGLFLRLAWNPHQVIWSYDQARDSFVTREIIKNKDIIILGPQAEMYGLFHGPLYYYLIAPFYYLSQGETLLPLIFMSLFILSSVIPLSLLVMKIVKDKLGGILVILIFVFSYTFIEYSRWLSNVSITIPFISWGYYLLYKILSEKVRKIHFFLLGLVLGFASQGEIFFLSLIAIFLATFIITKQKFQNLIYYLIGSAIGIAPLIIAQFKFGFMGWKIFSSLFEVGKKQNEIGHEGGQAVIGYLHHLGLTTHQTIGGLSAPMGLFIFIIILSYIALKFMKKQNKEQAFIVWFLTVLVAHAILFTFEYVDTVFLNIGLSIFLIVISGVAAFLIFKSNKLLFSLLAVSFLIFQLGLYKSYIIDRKPFGHYKFIQPASTLSHIDEIISAIYKYADGKPFTFSSIGTPFGVRTVWASAFELYSRKHSVPIPDWYGYFANGYPGDYVLKPAKDPEKLHVLVIESNISQYLSQPIFENEMNHQNEYTKVISEIKVNETKIQFRKPI